MSLKKLLERVETATGADRDLDKAICCHFEPKKIWVRDNNGIGFPGYIAPALTVSIDAAVALVEKMLPMSVWSIYNSDPKCVTTGGSAFIYADSDDDDAFRAAGASPALALLAAMLRALIKKEERA